MKVRHVRMEDILALRRRPASIDVGREYVFLGISATGGGFFKKSPVLGSQIRGGSAFNVEIGDLVYSRLFAWKGSFEIVGPPEHGCMVSGEFPSFVVDCDVVDASWLRYWLLSDAGLRDVHALSAGSTPGSRNRLREDRFLKIEITLPPIGEQRRVATGLDRLATAAKSLLGTFRHAGKVADALSVATCARPDLAEADKLKAGWRKANLANLIVPAVNLVSVDPTSTYPNLGIYSFGRGLFPKPVIAGGATSARLLSRVSSGQFIYSRLFAFEGAYAYVPAAFDGYFVSTEFPTFDLDIQKADPRWLATYLRSPKRWAELASASKGLGVRRQRISVEAVLGYEVWVPPIDEQKTMVETIERIESYLSGRWMGGDRIESLLPSALNRAFGQFS